MDGEASAPTDDEASDDSANVMSVESSDLDAASTDLPGNGESDLRKDTDEGDGVPVRTS